MKIAAKCGNYKSRFLNTNTGTPQGDCASAIEFNDILFLRRSLTSESKKVVEWIFLSVIVNFLCYQ